MVQQMGLRQGEMFALKDVNTTPATAVTSDINRRKFSCTLARQQAQLIIQTGFITVRVRRLHQAKPPAVLASGWKPRTTQVDLT